MKAFDKNVLWASREDWKIIDLPDDLMVYPCNDYENGYLKLCRSESVGKWYVLSDSSSDPEKGIYSSCLECGSWLDCISFFSCPIYWYCPVKYGEPIKSLHSNRLQYMPIYESVPTGEYNDIGEEIYKDVYKIVMMNLYPFPYPSNNVMDYNYKTGFSVYDYGENLVKMVSDLQVFTGKEF